MSERPNGSVAWRRLIQASLRDGDEKARGESGVEMPAYIQASESQAPTYIQASLPDEDLQT